MDIVCDNAKEINTGSIVIEIQKMLSFQRNDCGQ